MINKKSVITVLILFILLKPIAICADGPKYIEIFDPREDKVVKLIKTDKEINGLAIDCINGIHGIYGKKDPIRDDGYAVKIQLSNPVEVQNKWLNTIVNEIYIVIPQNNQAFFIVIENNKRPVCFPYNGDIKTLSKALDFKLR